jgi:hypothetical protein
MIDEMIEVSPDYAYGEHLVMGGGRVRGSLLQPRSSPAMILESIELHPRLCNHGYPYPFR